MPGLAAVAEYIDRIIAAIGRIAAWAVLVVVLVEFTVVLLRYGLGVGSIWLQETVVYAHAALFMLAAAWTLAAGGTCGSIFSTRGHPRGTRPGSIWSGRHSSCCPSWRRCCCSRFPMWDGRGRSWNVRAKRAACRWCSCSRRS